MIIQAFRTFRICPHITLNTMHNEVGIRRRPGVKGRALALNVPWQLVTYEDTVGLGSVEKKTNKRVVSFISNN